MLYATLIHGKPTRERYEDPHEPKPHVANWFGWIPGQLKPQGRDVWVPAMPDPYYPVYHAWQRRFETRPLAKRVVGHSAGSEFALRWFSANPEAKADKLLLVAPYTDEAGKYGDFSRYVLDPSLPQRVGELVIMYSHDDNLPIVRTAQRLAAFFPAARVLEFEDRGHFRIGHNMAGPEFPELLAELLAP